MKRWNTMKIALWGAGFGIIYTSMQSAMEGMFRFDPDHLAYVGGGMLGGAVGGAALFALVSGARNLFVKAR